MHKLLIKIYTEINVNFSRFYTFISLNFSIPTLTMAWVLSVFISGVLIIILKLLMFSILSNYLAGKLIVSLIVFILLFFQKDYLYRDFEKNPFSWSETINFLIFCVHLFVFLSGGISDLLQYLIYYRYDLPCTFAVENLDRIVDGCFFFILRIIATLIPFIQK